MEADMVSLLYISEPNSFRWCLVSLFWLSYLVWQFSWIETSGVWIMSSLYTFLGVSTLVFFQSYIKTNTWLSSSRNNRILKIFTKPIQEHVCPPGTAFDESLQQFCVMQKVCWRIFCSFVIRYFSMSSMNYFKHLIKPVVSLSKTIIGKCKNIS